MEKRPFKNPTFQKRNWCLTTAIGIFVLLTIYGISIPQTIRTIMASPHSEASPKIPVEVALSYTPPATTSTTVTLKAILENTSPTQPIYILKWSSPLDPHAAAVGVFSFNSTENGKEAPGLGLMINHQMPEMGYFSTDSEHIVKLDAGKKFEGTVEVKDHEILLVKGKIYDVQAKGRWMGVWIGEHERLGFEEGSDLLIGEFESEKIRIEIPV